MPKRGVIIIFGEMGDEEYDEENLRHFVGSVVSGPEDVAFFELDSAIRPEWFIECPVLHQGLEVTPTKNERTWLLDIRP